ncbi:MAG: metallophosphoesterase [Acidobacteria bacterium]|nr:metallophosphoesterase [Acidobacteriota bacterium]
MRLAILADIHGNFQALQAVLADMDAIGVDAVVSLGDNIGYGPEPEEVVQALMGRGVPSVVGNHELALSSQGYFNRLTPPPAITLEISRELLSRESLPTVCPCPCILSGMGPVLSMAARRSPLPLICGTLPLSSCPVWRKCF